MTPISWCDIPAVTNCLSSVAVPFLSMFISCLAAFWSLNRTFSLVKKKKETTSTEIQNKIYEEGNTRITVWEPHIISATPHCSCKPYWAVHIESMKVSFCDSDIITVQCTHNHFCYMCTTCLIALHTVDTKTVTPTSRCRESKSVFCWSDSDIMANTNANIL